MFIQYDKILQKPYLCMDKFPKMVYHTNVKSETLHMVRTTKVAQLCVLLVLTVAWRVSEKMPASSSAQTILREDFY